MKDKPQLSAEIDQTIIDEVTEQVELLIKMVTRARATEREKVLSEVEKLRKPDNYEKYCGCDGECFSSCDSSYNRAIDEVLAKLNQLKEENVKKD